MTAEQTNLVRESSQTANVTRRTMLRDAALTLTAAALPAAMLAFEPQRDYSMAVDDIVRNPDGLIHGRQVECSGLIRSDGNREVTISVGGYPISSSAVASGSISMPTPVKMAVPMYTLYGSTQDNSILVFRERDGIHGLSADWMTGDIETRIQRGEEMFVKVSGYLSIRDDRQYLVFHAISEVKPLSGN